MGPVKVDGPYMGVKRSNMSGARRKTLKDTGRGEVDKTAVDCLKDHYSKQVCAQVAEKTDAEILQRP